MRVQQIHELKDFGLVPPYTALLVDSKVHHNKTELAAGGDVVQVMLDVGLEDIQGQILPVNLLHVTWQVMDWLTADIYVQLRIR